MLPESWRIDFVHDALLTVGVFRVLALPASLSHQRAPMSAGLIGVKVILPMR
jgi:hypothetical protein